MKKSQKAKNRKKTKKENTLVRNYKDTVFRMLFNNKEKMLELYNALYDTNYPPGTPVDINTIEAALYVSKKNDISFTIDNTYLVITEHQSTINKNMPLRNLWYIAEIYKKMVNQDDIFKKTLIKLPRPTFVVMYNGTDPLPPETRLELSDCFLGDGESLLKLSVIVYNVNEGAGCSLLTKSPTLYQYSQLVSLVRKYWNRGTIAHHERQQIYDICMEKGILVDFMKEHGKTIIDMLSREFSEAEQRKLFKESGFEEGLELGREEGRKEGEKAASERLNKLGQLLEDEGRVTDLLRSMRDPAYQQRLLDEFGL